MSSHGSSETFDHVRSTDVLSFLGEKQAPPCIFHKKAHELCQVAGEDHGASVANAGEDGRGGGEAHEAGKIALGTVGPVD